MGDYEEYIEAPGGDVGVYLYSRKDLSEMGEIYEMGEYMPGYTAIGDDGGTYVFIVEEKTGCVYRVPSGGILEDNQTKVILRATQNQLIKLEESNSYWVVRDLGKTELEPNTLTCICLGVEGIDDIPKLVKKLQLYK